MRHWLDVHFRWLFKEAKLLFQVSLQEFIEDRCTQIAASISYFVFFSIFPLTIFLVTIFGQFLRNDSVKQQVVEALLDIIPLATEDGRAELEKVLDGVSTELSLLGMFALVGLIWSASAMMAALRGALNFAWDTTHRRPPLRGKIVDILMVFIVGALVALSIAGTWIRQYVFNALGDLSTILGSFDFLISILIVLTSLLFPVLISFAIFLMLYRFVPAVKTSFDEVWPGALIAAIGFELAKTGFTLYLQNFNNYNAVYGSLGAVVVFMLFIFIGANILLFGAEVASEWPKVRAGYYDDGLPNRAGKKAHSSLKETVVEAVRQSFFGDGIEEHVDDDLIEERTRRRRLERQAELDRRNQGAGEDVP